MYLRLRFKKFRGWTGERKVINSAGANRRVKLQRGMPRTWKVLKCRSCERKFYSCNILFLHRIYNTFCVFFFETKKHWCFWYMRKFERKNIQETSREIALNFYISNIVFVYVKVMLYLLGINGHDIWMAVYRYLIINLMSEWKEYLKTEVTIEKTSCKSHHVQVRSISSVWPLEFSNSL